MSNILHRGLLDGATTLSEAAEAFAASFGAAIGLVYGATCRFIVLEADGTIGAPTGPADCGDAFEARLFNPTAELRWLQSELQDDLRRGQAAILFDRPPERPPSFRTETRLPVSDLLSQRYLLWGQGDGSAAHRGWSALTSERIGTLAIPLGRLPAGKRAVLTAREYLSMPDERHGNVAVIEERLLALEVDHHA